MFIIRYELKPEEWELIDLPKPKIDATLPVLLEGKRSELKKLRKELNGILDLLKGIIHQPTNEMGWLLFSKHSSMCKMSQVSSHVKIYNKSSSSSSSVV